MAGYSARWRVFAVDRDTWADAGELAGVVSAKVSRDVTKDLLESASMTVIGGFEPGYYRITMLAGSDRVEIATLWFAADDWTNDMGAVEREATGYSVLKPADGQVMPIGSYAPAGCDGAEYAAGMLRGCIAAPVEVTASFMLDQHVVFDAGSTILEAVRMLLDAGGAIMQIAGDGTVRIMPRPEEASLALDRDAMGILGCRVTGSSDVSKVKNRWWAIDGGSVAVAANDDPDSPTSFRALGFWNDEFDDSPVRVDGETLQAYAERRLAEQSVLVEERKYTREWVEGILPGALVRGSLPDHGLDGDMRVTAQSINCDKGATVEETVEHEERTWPL